jgi:CHAT domain-containing protein
MERYDPEYTRKRRSVPLGQAELTRLLQRLPDRTAVVEYFACGDKLLALSITLHERTPRLKLRTLARSMAGEPWKSELGAPKYEEALSALVRESLKELLPDLDEISQIYFVPHGWIHGLPLHAARIYDKVVLLERAAIAYLPSLTALQYLEEADEAGQTKRLRRCLAFGYSASPLDADVFESEAKEVAERFGSKAFLGKEATRANLFNAHRDIDLIHFACHGMADSEGPFGAVLQLADGPLSPQDLMGRLPSAKIAVMTACFGQTSKVRPGDEAFGFARAMMYAGVRAVLAPLTATYLDQSVELTQRFYENLIDLQLSPAESLRRAQLVLRSDPEPIGDPHWAPYALVGLAESLRPEVL